MKVIITGGGTAGHVTPLLAVATELKVQLPDCRIRYVGKTGDHFGDMLAGSDSIERHYKISAGKWRRYHGIGWWRHLLDVKTLLLNVRDAFLFALGFFQSLVILLGFRPALVFVKGGFVGLPVGLAAACLGIPIVTHDSDTIPGLTNRLLAPFASAQAVALPVDNYSSFYKADKLHFTGVPVRSEFFVPQDAQRQARQRLGLAQSAKVVAVVGGSLGAVRLNQALLAGLDALMTDVPSLEVIWVTGKVHFDELQAAIGQREYYPRLHLISLTLHLEDVVAAADVVVSRAGATSIAELAAAAKPIILVPNPYLTGGHQQKNALSLQDSGAAVVITEDQIESDKTIVASSITRLLNSPAEQTKLSRAIQGLSVKDAPARIVAVIKEVANK